MFDPLEETKDRIDANSKSAYLMTQPLCSRCKTRPKTKLGGGYTKSRSGNRLFICKTCKDKKHDQS